MVIEPRVWGFICTTAHPTGCAANVREQIDVTRRAGVRRDGPKRVLVIGASTGYGLAARITAAFGFGAATLGVMLEKPPRARKPASAGWYNAAAFEREARAAGLASVSLNADAFADATRTQAIDLIRAQLGGPVDLVIYSLAAPARKLPASGGTVRTALKPIGAPFSGITIDTDTDRLAAVSVEPASDDEIGATVAVMGGADWTLWIDALRAVDLLAPDARTVAFSYLGPELTWPIYRDGTIGRAKADLERCARAMSARAGEPGFARVAVLKSIVTQASAAIPVIPLYLSLVSRVMRERGVDEGAIEQQNRLFREVLYPDSTACGAPVVRSAHATCMIRDAAHVDEAGRVRLDERELAAEVQDACIARWPRINDANLFEITDYARYKREFLRLFGFARDAVDYAAEVDPMVASDGIVTSPTGAGRGRAGAAD